MKATTVRLTGPSCCGKTSMADSLKKILIARGYDTIVTSGKYAHDQKDWRFIIVDEKAANATASITFGDPHGMHDLAMALLGVANLESAEKYGRDGGNQ